MRRSYFKKIYSYWKRYSFRHLFLWSSVLTLYLLFFATSAFLPFLFKAVIDALSSRNLSGFLYWILIYLGVELAQVFFLFARNYGRRHLEVKVQRQLQKEVYQRYQTSPYSKLLNIQIGEMLQRLRSDAPKTLTLAVKSFAELSGHLVLVTIILALSFTMAPLLAGVAVGFMLLYSIGYHYYRKKAPELADKRQKAEAEFNSKAEEGLNALYSVRVQGLLQRTMDRFTKTLNNYLSRKLDFFGLNIKFKGGFTTAITSVSEIGVISLGAWLIFKGQTTVGTLIAFSQYLNWLYRFVQFMSDFASQIEPALISWDRVHEILEWEEKLNIREPISSQFTQESSVPLLIQGLTFEFDNKVIFEDLNMKVEPNDFCAVSADSGRGKTTLINLIAGIHPPPKDSIFLYGRDVANLQPEEILSVVVIAEQEPQFFSGEVAKNLTPVGDNRNKEKVIATAELLGVKELVTNLWSASSAAKLTDLSGGERKRLGLVRALARDGSLYLLDEPTAFLEKKIGREILRNLKTNFADKTILIFSHDPNVPRLANKSFQL